MLTQKEVKELINYNPDSGEITIIKRTGTRSRKIGEFAGVKVYRATSSYLQITLLKQTFYAHRLVWLYMTGEYPKVIDHIDGDGLNNKWNNLRNGDVADNNRNVLKIQHNKIEQLPIGVFRHRKKFTAAIKYNYKKIYLGVFNTIDDAVIAYKNAKDIYHKAGA
jgi:hypothetical protein